MNMLKVVMSVFSSLEVRIMFKKYSEILYDRINSNAIPEMKLVPISAIVRLQPSTQGLSRPD